jgi:hypothetical protein
MKVSDRPTALTVHRSCTFMSVKWSKTLMERLQAFMGRLCKRSGTMNGCNAGRSGMSKNVRTGRTNVLERIVENVHVHVSKMKEKLYLIPGNKNGIFLDAESFRIWILNDFLKEIYKKIQ